MTKYKIQDNTLISNVRTNEKRNVKEFRLFYGSRLTKAYRKLLTQEYAGTQLFNYTDAIKYLKQIGLINDSVAENAKFKSWLRERVGATTQRNEQVNLYIGIDEIETKYGGYLNKATYQYEGKINTPITYHEVVEQLKEKHLISNESDLTLKTKYKIKGFVNRHNIRTYEQLLTKYDKGKHSLE